MNRDDVIPKVPKRAKMARRLRENRRKGKFLSGTTTTSVQVTPDGVSIIFQSMKQGHTVYWPTADWAALRKWLDSELENSGQSGSS